MVGEGMIMSSLGIINLNLNDIPDFHLLPGKGSDTKISPGGKGEFRYIEKFPIIQLMTRLVI